MIIKLTVGEMDALSNYDGPFGEKGFDQFMTSLNYRINEETGEIDIDDEDVKTMNKYRVLGHKREIDRILKRSMDAAMRKFMGK